MPVYLRVQNSGKPHLVHSALLHIGINMKLSRAIHMSGMGL